MGIARYLRAFFAFLGLAFLTRGSGGVFSSVRRTSSGLGAFALLMVWKPRPWTRTNQFALRSLLILLQLLPRRFGTGIGTRISFRIRRPPRRSPGLWRKK